MEPLERSRFQSNDEGNACDKDIYVSLQEAKTSELSVHHDVNRGSECPQQDDVSLQVKRRGPEWTHLPNPLALDVSISEFTKSKLL